MRFSYGYIAAPSSIQIPPARDRIARLNANLSAANRWFRFPAVHASWLNRKALEGQVSTDALKGGLRPQCDGDSPFGAYRRSKPLLLQICNLPNYYYD